MAWIKLHTKFLEWGWADEPNMVSLFVHLLLMANYKDKEWHGITIHRGQLVTSYDKLSASTGLSIRSLRTCLAKLEKTGEIVRKATKQFATITICKYDSYQDFNQTSDKQPTNERQTTDKQPTTTTEYKNNINNIERDNARTHEENVIADVFAHQSLIEQFCMTESITLEQCYNYAQAIVTEWKLTGETHTSITDARKHLLNTIRIKAQADRKAARDGKPSRDEWETQLQGVAIKAMNNIINNN